MQAADAGLRDLLTMRFPTSSSAGELQKRALDDLEQLIRRAQNQGDLRSDFVSSDLPMLLFANAGVVSATRDNAPDTWQRFTAYMIDAFRAEYLQAPARTLTEGRPRYRLAAQRELLGGAHRARLPRPGLIMQPTGLAGTAQGGSIPAASAIADPIRKASV